jgi:hypothetical protein
MNKNDDDGMIIVSFECNHCGWDWVGNFAYCPYCRHSDVSIIDYESVKDFVDRMMSIREREMEESFFIIEDKDFYER